jgi:16S rRNA (guanine966-N2)-methyltransferase
MKKTPSTPHQQSSTGQLRIIGGQWRGRKLNFPAIDDLRPTPNRIRETLFNWLAPTIEGAHCLDCFAGSGALGLEALSRGAAHTCFTDTSRQAITQLKENLSQLNANNAEALQLSALDHIAANPKQHYDIVFVDAPFSGSLAEQCLQALVQSPLLKNKAWVYLEMNRSSPLPPLPPNWQLHREKTAGQVSYRLFKVASEQGN